MIEPRPTVRLDLQLLTTDELAKLYRAIVAEVTRRHHERQETDTRPAREAEPGTG